MHFEHGRARRRKGLIPSRADVLWLGNLYAILRYQYFPLWFEKIF
jgi:hypothetical protein